MRSRPRSRLRNRGGGWPPSRTRRPRECLYPPRSGRLLADDEAVQERRGLRQSFLGREDAVLVFDGEHIIVSEHAEGGDELAPPLLAVTVAAGAEDPGAIALV